MRPERSDAAAIHDMLRAAETVVRYLSGKTREDYEGEPMLRHAVERNLEIIGEAARRLTQQFIAEHPQVPWRAVMATRHILAHEYDEVDNEIVWRIAQVHVPELIRQLRPLLPPPPALPPEDDEA